MTKTASRTGVIPVVALSVLGAAVSIARALPPQTVNAPYRSGNNFGGIPINSSFLPGLNAGQGFLGASVNNSAEHFVHLSLFANPGFNQGIADSTGGLGVPYLLAGVSSPDAGSITVPTADYSMNQVYSTSMNNAGDAVFVVRLGPHEFSSVTPTTGVLFNKSTLSIRQGDPVTAAGVMPGTVWAAFDNTSSAFINDSNTVLIGSRIIELGIPRNALIKVQLDPAGAVISQTLIAKVAGPVGAGPAIWSSIPLGSHLIAFNNPGNVLFTGVTSDGVDGLYLTSGASGAIVAQAGGPSPVAGTTWSAISGSPVALNNSNQWAIRATLAGADTVWTEQGDAGESFSGFFSFTANGTVGGGWLRQINGTLSDDHDVDLYYIRVGNPALQTQEPFSITCVPDPSSGFAGASFDSVLYLFRDFHNANGATRTGLGRCDNVSSSILQSALGPASLQNGHANGTAYFLAISTPKARAIAGFSTTSQMWADDPAAFVVAGGTLYWIDPSEGQIRRLNTTTGVELSPLQVGPIPTQTNGQIAEDSPLLMPLLALYDTGGGGPGSKLYFVERRYFPSRLKRCDLDGSNVEIINDTTTTPALAGLNILQVDNTNAKVYWSRPFTNGTVHRCDLDGANPVQVFALDGTRVASMAIDPVGGKIYYQEPIANSFNRCNLDGTFPQVLGVGTNITSMAADVTGRTLYMGTTTGAIRRRNLDTGTNLTDLTSTNPTPSMAIDSGAGQLCWTVPAERRLRRTPTTGGPVQEWLSVGLDIGERPADGQGYLDGLHTPAPFQRSGNVVSTPLPYEIRLTGCTAVYPLTVVARGNTKVALTGEPSDSSGPDGITTIGELGSPIRISDNGLVAWRGRWISTVAPTGLRTALFLDDKEVIRDTTAVPGAIGGIAATVLGGQSGFDMSDSGQHLVLLMANGSFSGAGNTCLTLSFDSPPAAACLADFNNSGSVTVQDIFDFLSAYFTSSPAADINSSGTVTVQDIFDFLALYFAGCP